MDKRPIGVFDSGVGGITVLLQIIKLLPNEDIIYLGDTGRLPYGTKSKENIIGFTRQSIDFLISKNVKAIVIACGTATSQALETVKSEYDIPIIGVIEPTVSSLTDMDKKVGVIATSGTVSSKEWDKKINEHNSDIDVVSVACPLLAQMAEEGWTENEIAELTIKEYLKPFKNSGISKLILGCTHYPLFKRLIQEELGEKVDIVDTGEKTAIYLKELLNKKGLNNEGENKFTKYKIYLTDIGGNFVNVANSLLNGIVNINENEIEKVELV